MTIRHRLLVSHLMMFFAPILMLLITVATVLAGVMVYIQSGNHVYIESSDQFNRAADILYNTVFHHTRTPADVDDAGDYAPLIQVLDPEQNYVLLRKGDRELYRYGNEALTALFPDIPPAEDLHELNHPEKGAYELIKNNEYLMIRKRTVDGVPYYLYYISHQAPHGTDDRLEHVSRGGADLSGHGASRFHRARELAPVPVHPAPDRASSERAPRRGGKDQGRRSEFHPSL